MESLLTDMIEIYIFEMTSYIVLQKINVDLLKSFIARQRKQEAYIHLSA